MKRMKIAKGEKSIKGKREGFEGFEEGRRRPCRYLRRNPEKTKHRSESRADEALDGRTGK